MPSTFVKAYWTGAEREQHGLPPFNYLELPKSLSETQETLDDGGTVAGLIIYSRPTDDPDIREVFRKRALLFTIEGVARLEEQDAQYLDLTSEDEVA